jgi:hypothetical protein
METAFQCLFDRARHPSQIRFFGGDPVHEGVASPFAEGMVPSSSECHHQTEVEDIGGFGDVVTHDLFW